MWFVPRAFGHNNAPIGETARRRQATHRRSRRRGLVRRGSLSLEFLECRSLLAAVPAFDQVLDDGQSQAVAESIQQIAHMPIHGDTGEKPQSKVWRRADTWWSVIPNDSGTWLWRLDDLAWTPVLKLTNDKGVRADVKSIGNLAYVLLFHAGSTQLATVQYVPGAPGTYQFAPGSPAPTNVPLTSAVEMATIDIDSTGRMWLASDLGSNIEVRYSDGPYATWSSPINLASNVDEDDISVVTAFPDGKIGVLWSNQNTDRFYFRYHVDGASPSSWSTAEVAASQGAGTDMADDHVNVAVAADGTLYAAIKTSYSGSLPTLGLMVRHPNGSWDPLHGISTGGTRPIVMLNEVENTLIVAYTATGISYRESSMSSISFGPELVMIPGGSLNNASSTKQNFTDELVVIASEGSTVYGALITTTTPPNQAPVVNAGSDRTELHLPDIALDGTVGDDGPMAALDTMWTKVSGPGTATFANASSVDTTVTFSAPGTYVLGLWADDGEAVGYDELQLTVADIGSLQSIAFQDGTSPMSSYAGTRDARMVSGNPTNKYGNNSKLEIDGSPSVSTVLQWDLSLVPPGTSVAMASMTFQVTGSTSSNYNAFGLKRSWTEGDVTWNSAAAGVNWEVPGALGTTDRDSIVLGSIGPATSGPATVQLNAAGVALVQSWINNPSTNFGMVFSGTAANTDNVEISSSEISTLSSRPKLTLFFTPGGGGPTNQAPSVSAGPDRNVTLPAAASLDGTVSDDGLPNPPAGVTTTWSKFSGPGTVTFGNSAAVDTTATFSAAGSYILRLTANDGSLSGWDDMTVVVAPAPAGNQAPTVNAGTDQGVLMSSAASLDGTVNDDGLPNPPASVVTGWTKFSGPGAVTFANSAAVDTTATFNAAGTYVLRLTANDGQMSTSDDVTITVSEATSGNTVVFQDGVWPSGTYSGTRDAYIRSDKPTNQHGTTNTLETNGDPLRSMLLAWDTSSIPAGSSVQSVSLTFNVVNGTASVYELYELKRAWVETGVTWNVASGTNWAVAGALGPTDRGSTLLGTISTSLTGLATVQLNAAGVAVVQSWINSPTSNFGIVMAGDPVDTDSLQISSREASSAANRPKLTVIYSGGSGPTNQAPSVSAGPDRTVTLPGVASLDGTVTDDALPNPPAGVTTTWTKFSGPGTVTFGNASAVDTTASFSVAGTYVLWLTANDGSLSTTDDVTVVVAAAPPGNQAPSVNAGADQGVLIASAASLDGTVSDDGLPSPPAVTTTWSKFSGPSTVTFANSTAVDTTATFGATGTYVLRLTANDSQLSTSDDVTITVSDASGNTTAVFQDGVSAGGTYTGTIDSYIRSDKPTNQNGINYKLEANGDPLRSMLIAWDTSTIPAGSFVQSASITLNVTNTSSSTYELYELKRAWAEAQASWNSATTSTPWEVPGALGTADRGASILATVAAPTTGLVTIPLNGAGVALVQYWIDHPQSNFGIVISGDASDTDSLQVDSSEATTAANRPKLTVIYSTGSSSLISDEPSGGSSQAAAMAPQAASAVNTVELVLGDSPQSLVQAPAPSIGMVAPPLAAGVPNNVNVTTTTIVTASSANDLSSTVDLSIATTIQEPKKTDYVAAVDSVLEDETWWKLL